MPFDSPCVALVVEDEPLLLIEIVEKLEGMGIRAHEALGHERALEFIHGEERLDLLVTDIRLGGPTEGWEIAVSAREQHPQVQVIYLSANDALEDRMVKGAVFLGKPCNWSDFEEKVRAALPR